jgi:homoserine kinase
MERRRVVRVPASSANLGPGFDALAAALALNLELEVRETGTFEIVTDLDVPLDRSNLVVRAFEHLHPADGLRFSIASEIPMVGGLGSSAAAIVAGLVAADHLYELDADLLGAAIELEGHPDNVAAALRGGFVVCTGDQVARFDAPVGLEAVVAIPRTPVQTAEARAALPPEVPIADAVFNIGRTALLTLGLARGEWDLVAAGLHDRIHEPRRAHLYPLSLELAERARQLGALGATISGAGPALLVWTHYEQTGGVLDGLRRAAGDQADVMRVPFEPQGADVRSVA